MPPDAEALLYSPARALWILLRYWWAERRCAHPDWQPFETCPGCGKEPQ
jgi:hypothetical protein